MNTASQALQSLGLNIADFESKEAMFDGIIDALSNMQDKTLQAAYANEIFGDKVANQMLPYLNAGSDAINQFKGEFEQIGYLSNEQVAALATLDDTYFLLKESIKNDRLANRRVACAAYATARRKHTNKLDTEITKACGVV